VRVSVKAKVDAAGNVTGAKLDSAGPSKYFARLALQATQAWKFAPAQQNGQPIPSEWIIRFAFGSRATDVTSKQVSR
jgi:TonB family protein